LRRVYRDQLDAVAAGKDPMGVTTDPARELVCLDAGTAVERLEQ
jgi:hypothetical protein